MKEFYPVLAGCALFEGIAESELSAILACLDARITTAAKNQTLFHEGDPADFVGIVLSGAVQILRDDVYGNRSIVGRAVPGELFGESFACAGVASLPVSIAATEESRLMLINCHRITVSCSSACSFHSRMIANLLKAVAVKNLQFHQKLQITAMRTTREKLMAYLAAQAKHHGSRSFTIPYDRQGLADYLGVERSAMAAEISRLRRDGIIECKKSRFTLL